MVEPYVFGKVLESVEHVEAMEVDGPRCHCGVGKSEGLAQLRDEAGADPSISCLRIIFHTLVL